MSARHAGAAGTQLQLYRPGDIAAISALGSARRAVSRQIGVAPDAIRYGRRGGLPDDPDVRLAKRAALYLAVVACDRRLREVARAAGCSVEFVRQALASIEEARDCPRLDAVLEILSEEVSQC
jgi:hypothetical protein